MCAVRREISIDFKELRRLSISCRCGTVITMDAGPQAKSVPVSCPGCGKAFSDMCSQAIRSFRESYRLLELAPESDAPTVSIQIPFPE